MGKKTESTCLDLPLHKMSQEIFDLSSNFCIAIIHLKFSLEINDLTRRRRHLQLHIKFVEKETKRFVCMDTVFLIELYRQLKQFECANIEYPCNAARDIGLSIKETTNPGEYQFTFEKKKFILDPATVKNLLREERDILKHIRDIEHLHFRGGYDQVDC